MPTPASETLYARAKRIADQTYDKPSAYKSAFIQRQYRQLGGKYVDDGKPKLLKRWFNEKWRDVGGEQPYPVYRPTRRVSPDTPLTVSEVDPQNLKEQIKLKQKIKGTENLPPFKGRML